MSKLVYVGSVAGLVKHEQAVRLGKGGDMADPANYNLLCSCTKELGPLAKFTPNTEGDRSAYCSVCAKITIVDKHGQIKAHGPFDIKKFLDEQRRKLQCEQTNS